MFKLDIKSLFRIWLPQEGHTALSQATREVGDYPHWKLQDLTGQIHSRLDQCYSWCRGTQGTGTQEMDISSGQRRRCLVILMELKNLVLLKGEQTQQDPKPLPQYNFSYITLQATVSSRPPFPTTTFPSSGNWSYKMQC